MRVDLGEHGGLAKRDMAGAGGRERGGMRCNYILVKLCLETREMAVELKAWSALPEDLSSVPSTLVVVPNSL